LTFVAAVLVLVLSGDGHESGNINLLKMEIRRACVGVATFALLLKMLSGISEQRQKTSTVSALDRFGWTVCDVMVQRKTLTTVHTTAGVYIAVDITISSLFPALQVSVGLLMTYQVFLGYNTQN